MAERTRTGARRSEVDRPVRRVEGRAKREEKRELVRGEPIVQRVLAATIEELSCVGYRALRIEDVASRAEVNKTTVYRRWPEKCGLVRDALRCAAAGKFITPETGSLRSDLVAMGRHLVEAFSTPRGRSIVRMMVAESTDDELSDIKRDFREERAALPLAVLGSAIARGEISKDADLQLLLNTFIGSIQHRLFFMSEPVTDAYLGQLVDLLIEGVKRAPPRATGARVTARSRTRRSRAGAAASAR
jgi:AcrR family transcriptional regulator